MSLAAWPSAAKAAKRAAAYPSEDFILAKEGAQLVEVASEASECLEGRNSGDVEVEGVYEAWERRKHAVVERAR